MSSLDAFVNALKAVLDDDTLDGQYKVCAAGVVCHVHRST
jgi:hypothetical protein